MKKRTQGLVIAVLVLLGMGFLLYSPISQWLANRNASEFIGNYELEVESLEEQVRERELKKAEAFNLQLLTGEITDPFRADNRPDLSEEYLATLNVTNTGLMGYLEIPKINSSLPIYHGVLEDTLKKGIGHLDNTALPVGGQGNHAVLTGHSGLASARLFTDLDKLELQDVFHINVLGRKLTYEVDNITVIEPHDTNTLLPVPGKDYVTLITCTPYGINSHRLLVRGHQIPNIGEETTHSPLMNERMTLVVLLGILLFIVIVLYYDRRRRRKVQTRRVAHSHLLLGLMIPCLLFSGVLGITTLASGNTEPIPGHNNSIQEMNSLMEQDDAGAIFIHTTSLEEVDFTVTKMNKVTWVTDYQDLEGNYYEKSSTSFTISADETGLATFTDLPMGDYYVEEISHNSLSLYGEPFFVHLPAPHPKRSDEMLTSVNIYLKETKLGIDKYARNDSSMGGRLAHWQITTNISRGLLGRADIFAVSDELDRRLEYVEGSGVIKADDGTGNFTDVTNWFDIHLEGQTLTFTLKQEYDVDFLEYTQVDFDFTTVINIQNESDLTDIFNVANVQYQGASQMVPDHPEDTIPYVTPYGIQVILQNDAAAKGALSDAVFELLDYNGKSVTSPDGADSWLAQSDENGMLWFLGLTEGTYYLKMNTAPKGFESLSDVIPATLNDNNTSDNNVLTIPIDTIEQKGILPRPKTGDMENQLFLLIGISTVSGALIIGVLYAKKGKKR